jgi:hypothetical protein
MSTSKSQHGGSNPSLTAMVYIKDNFITDSENLFLLNEMNSKLKISSSREGEFYEWYEIDEKDTILNSLEFMRILNRHLLFSKNSFGQNLKLHYVGFANQTKGFDYHADSVWPEEEEKRNLGTPSNQQNNFLDYKGNWIPNYVPTRKFTTVLYLNDDFEGGETHFPTLEVLVKPEKNKIVGFGCDEKYVHGVMPTSGGIRKAFICWFE